MFRISIDHPYRPPEQPRTWVTSNSCSYMDPSRAVRLLTLAAARELIARRRARQYPTDNVRLEFDCPVMQAAYDLSPEESKIT